MTASDIGRSLDKIVQERILIRPKREVIINTNKRT